MTQAASGTQQCQVPLARLAVAFILATVMLSCLGARGAEAASYEDTFYVAPIVGSPTEAKLLDLKKRLGKGAYYAKPGFTANVYYMSETAGAANDFVFDSSDSLDNLISLSKKHNLPIVIVLNGGPWGGTVNRDPDESLIAFLENDPVNVQWKDDGTVPSDETPLKGLGRILTYNNVNSEIRAYRKRNIQAATRKIAAFYRERPDLMIGVNTDPEIFMSPFYYSDYNPDTVAEFRAAQKAKFNGNLGALNRALGTSFGSWGAVGPPRPAFGDSIADNPWGEAWAEFRIGLVDQEVQREVDWIRQAGLPANRVYTHQTVRWDLPFWMRYSLSSTLETAAVNGGSIGITTLQDLCFREDLLAQARSWSPNWGIFEFNPSLDADKHDFLSPNYNWGDHYLRTYRGLETAYKHGAHILSPYYWDRERNEPYYSVRGSAYEIAIRDFLRRAGTDVQRIWGQTSHGTAVALSRATWGNPTPVVVLARSDHFSDALAGVPLAYSFIDDPQVGTPIPILLTNPDTLSLESLAEMKRLNVKIAMVLGGPGALSEKIERQLRGNGILPDRIWQESAYGTAADVAKRLGIYAAQWGSPPPDTAVVAFGENFQDSLAVSSPAAANRMPILLTMRDRLPRETIEALETLGIKKVIIVGGKAVVSGLVEMELKGRGITILDRLAGATADGTAVAIAEAGSLFGFTSPGPVFVTRGDHFTDGLSGGALAARMNPAPIVLVDPTEIPTGTRTYLSANKDVISRLYVLGGAGAISETVLEELDSL